MNLVIDIGNTAIKTGWFEGDELLEKQYHLTPENLRQLINVKKPSNVIASSTGKELFDGHDWDQVHIFKMGDKLKFPFKIEYSTPETLGSDRIAAVAGAKKKFPADNVLVIDMGTCVTYDFISWDSIYFGGAISPGVSMRFNAMHTFTSRLPQLPVPDYFPALEADSTVNCMKSGVMNGLLFEMEGMIAAYTGKYEQLKVLLTGGNAHLFEKKFKEPIFAAPDLILIGLNVILQHNVESS